MKHLIMKHLMPTNPTKSRARRKPSQLLTSALALLGPRGQWWVKNTEHVAKMDPYPTPLSKKDKMVNHDRFCAIGALHKINTPREREAQLYLQVAMAQLQPHHSHYVPWWSPFLAFVDTKTKVRDIPSFNDGYNTKWPSVRRAFKIAIRLAKNDGN